MLSFCSGKFVFYTLLITEHPGFHHPVFLLFIIELYQVRDSKKQTNKANTGFQTDMLQTRCLSTVRDTAYVLSFLLHLPLNLLSFEAFSDTPTNDYLKWSYL